MINNCKQICKAGTVDSILMSAFFRTGCAFAIGYTYEKSDNPNYCFFIYTYVGANNIFTVGCYNYVWVVRKATMSPLS